MTVFYDNAAGRLYRVLTGLRDVHPQTMTVRDAWRQVLRVDMATGGMVLLSRRLTEVFQLPASVANEVMQIEEDFFDHDFAMRWWEPVQRTFSDSLFAAVQISQVLHFDREALASLESCSYLLHKYRNESSPPETELQSVLSHVSEIEDLINRDQSIAPALAEFILEHAQAIREAIEDFSLVGASGIQEVVDEAVGAAWRKRYVLDKSDAEVAEAETGSKAAVKRFWGMIGHAAVVVAMVGDLAAIGQAAYTDFEGQPHTPPAIENSIVVDNSPRSNVAVIETGSGSDRSTASQPGTAGR